jgi:hypothetical protein
MNTRIMRLKLMRIKHRFISLSNFYLRLRFFPYYCSTYFYNYNMMEENESNHKIVNSNTNNKEMAGFFKQLLLILWKNLLIIKQNKTGLVCELLFSSLFTFIFVALVYFYNPQVVPKQFIDFESAIRSNLVDFTRLHEPPLDLYYYPNTHSVKTLVSNAYAVLKLKNTYLKLNLIEANVSNAELLDTSQKANLFALISFDQNGLDGDLIKYSIYTKE